MTHPGTNVEGRVCAEAAEYDQYLNGGELATECLNLEFAFDVAADFRTDESSEEGGLRFPSVVTPDGKQIELAIGERGIPGTDDNWLTAEFAGAVPGSTLRWETGSDLVGWTTHVYEVPPADQFLPVFS